MHSCFTSCIFVARTPDFVVKFWLVFRYEAVVFRRYVLALLSVGLLRKFEAYLVYLTLKKKSKALEAARPNGAGAYPGFCSMKRLEVFLLPLDEMLVHRRSLPRKLSGFPQQFAGTHLYTWVERGTVRVKCLA